MSSSSATKAQFITNKMCPFAQKAWIALEVSNTPYTLQEVSLYGAGGKPNWFLKLNPCGTVPVLSVNDGRDVYPDSELILDFISKEDNDLTRGCDQNDAILISNVKMWREIISNKVIPIGKRAVLGGSRQPLYELLTKIDDKVQGKYLCGDKFTVADCCAFPFIWRLDQEFGVEGKLKNWLISCENEKSFQKTIQNSWWWWW